MSPVTLTFGSLKCAEARAHHHTRTNTNNRHGLKPMLFKKSISSRELASIKNLRDFRRENEKTTTSVTPTTNSVAPTATSVSPTTKSDNSSSTEKIVQPKASDIASNAAVEAKAAADAQNMAGRQAAHQVKVQLANKAAQSAKAAEAALSGKITLIEQLEDEERETQYVFKAGMRELERVKENTEAALKAVGYSRQQLQVLMRAVETAKASMQISQLSAQGAKTTLSNKEALLIAANKRVVELKKRLDVANEELAKTSAAAARAESAARDARSRVSHVDLPLLGMPS